ncbi:acetyltransferase family protein [Streptomyces laurentii]|uniref:Acetyltransferase family protein n=1 Tax=Streptomyces laurentii TaxID=39478 RepID=A0A169PAI5_STRLU|nr:acetyltransferase family protein [Streptomyces laurentii]
MTQPDRASAGRGTTGRITYRVAESERDKSAVIKGEFTSDTVFEVVESEDGFGIRPTRLDPPLHKVFPDEEPWGDQESEGTRRFVALDDDRVCGYVDASYESWNRRLTIADIEVAGPYQGRGIGRTLMDHAVDWGRTRGAGHVWLEVTHINAPAVHAYERMGFSLCGLDTSLYRGTASEGEIALFMSRLLDEPAPLGPGRLSRMNRADMRLTGPGNDATTPNTGATQ